MAHVYVSIGSNINRYQHVGAALDALSTHFGELQISPVYESKSVGFDGSDFLNMVAGFDSDLAVGELSTLLRRVEYDNGRRRDGPKFAPRTLDIDILTYDNSVGDIDGVLLPREEINYNAFVLLPLADIAENVLHPVSKQTYGAMWAAYDKASQQLWPVDFKWRGDLISSAK